VWTVGGPENNGFFLLAPVGQLGLSAPDRRVKQEVRTLTTHPVLDANMIRKLKHRGEYGQIYDAYTNDLLVCVCEDLHLMSSSVAVVLRGGTPHNELCRRRHWFVRLSRSTDDSFWA